MVDARLPPPQGMPRPHNALIADPAERSAQQQSTSATSVPLAEHSLVDGLISGVAAPDTSAFARTTDSRPPAVVEIQPTLSGLVQRSKVMQMLKLRSGDCCSAEAFSARR